MIVQAYLSFGWGHTDSHTEQRIQRMTLAEFALTQKPSPWGAVEVGTAKFYRYLFQPLTDPDFEFKEGMPALPREKNVDRLLVSYDHMVLAYRHMLSNVSGFLELPEPVSEMIYHATCCAYKESPTSLLESMTRRLAPYHGESSRLRLFLPGSYRERLKEDTNHELKKLFQQELELIQSVWSWDAYSSFPPTSTQSTDDELKRMFESEIRLNEQIRDKRIQQQRPGAFRVRY
eukprot:TRINITY_DN19009_c0_g1_i1.p1 TRINITY_DN19009_c0_g1~~TRINITY_DN19009_c0_g1_i1.p1  ORF type:complete len:232 (+),score=36.22 TRINITY_DN19009_c0_g1_i1:593-1288(+)